MSATERKGYIDAVKCLMAKPAITPKTLLPGVSNHFEDYLGTHILQMQNIHFVVRIIAPASRGVLFYDR